MNDVSLPRLSVLDSEMAYRETGSRDAPVGLFLHGNPTSSFIWRKILPLVAPTARCIAPDLIGFGQTLNPIRDHHDILMSNVFAQAEALAFGKTEDEVRAEGTADSVVPQRVFEGNRPTNVILVEKLTPHALGTLVALYTTARNNDGAIKLANLTQRVGDLLQVTKLVTIFDVYDSEEKALDSFRKGAAA